MNLIEKILSSHSGNGEVSPGQIVDIFIDSRVARDFGGANVVKNLKDFGLGINDPGRTLFTFDCNPTGSDQKYAVNQQICRVFAREHGIRVYDIDAGIGTHLLVEEGYAWPGSTAVSTDSHANILGAIGSFGQGMGDQDIAAAWHNGKVWFKVPESVRINFTGKLDRDVTAKDFILNLLGIYGANTLLGYSIEMYGDCIDSMTLDERMTVSSMATEMGAIIILFPPSQSVIDYCSKRSRKNFIPLFADEDARYSRTESIDVTTFKSMVSRPGEPHDTVPVDTVRGLKIDSAFVGSCTNGRYEDLHRAAKLLEGRKVAPGVVLKIVPATDAIWKKCLEKGLINIFKESGALVSNAGCAGCAAGQVGQNGQGEVTISTGNRNFPGKQGKGNVWLISPEVVIASALAGYITTPSAIPDKPALFEVASKPVSQASNTSKDVLTSRPTVLTGRVWLIGKDNIDTDMIFHNRYLAITEMKEMGQYTFDNLKGYEDFARKAGKGDIVFTGKNFGSGSSRQQAVDCFISLGIQAVIAESFGAIYERNAINAAFPIITCNETSSIDLQDGDKVIIDLKTGIITNTKNGLSLSASPFSDVQLNIYTKGGLLGK
ncbi:MAG: aconitase/3-isopropylmalate dehydratase large subunit family protein [Bacteroidales bacterium]